MINNKNVLDTNIQKINFLNLQITATIGFIIALIISYLLSYDKKLSLENKRRLFDNETAQSLSVLQSVLVFFISISFLYINYKRYLLAKALHENDEQDLFLQIETSIFAIISSIIGLYIVFKNYRNKNLQITQTELL